MNLNEVAQPEHADYALHWAIMREFDLRYKRYQRACKGLTYFVTEATKTMTRINEVFVGIES